MNFLFQLSYIKYVYIKIKFLMLKWDLLKIY
jgi:hypothetical protein